MTCDDAEDPASMGQKVTRVGNEVARPDHPILLQLDLCRLCLLDGLPELFEDGLGEVELDE